MKLCITIQNEPKNSNLSRNNRACHSRKNGNPTVKGGIKASSDLRMMRGGCGGGSLNLGQFILLL